MMVFTVYGQPQSKLKILFGGRKFESNGMATRSSARLSPPPQPLLQPTPSTVMSDSAPKIPISTAEWTQKQVEEYSIHITETSDMASLLPKEYTTEPDTTGYLPFYRNLI